MMLKQNRIEFLEVKGAKRMKDAFTTETAMQMGIALKHALISFLFAVLPFAVLI